ncbi:hypothetical protein NQ314_009787 [Rhamnusium bicolor]|uniref:PiggyBac transposable element-derived protein domain-containing protein n=1 Tax=Rhamnusium bicolor TaxID=1586634 RepID=A0AAV8XXU9_9CUCU|nr:hypothetical protein NQ314_009787 [Rhamnusium bicolor]
MPTKKGFHDFNVTNDDIYKYFAIILLSGYNPVTSRRVYWETKADTHNTLVANSMPRNRFEQIHRFLHFNDNPKINKNDKLYKIRPSTDHINKLSTDCIQPLGKYFSRTKQWNHIMDDIR